MKTPSNQVQLWNGPLGEAWVKKQAFLDHFLNQISMPSLVEICRKSKLSDHILDLGCGCGTSTLNLAENVAVGVKLTGVDFSKAMIECAQSSAQEMGIYNAQFKCLDIQEDTLPENTYSMAFSRLGLMFFSDPYKAFKNIFQSLKQEAFFSFICFQEASKNPLLYLPKQILSKYLELDPQDPKAPGPFALSDPEYIHDILQQSAFVDIECKAVESKLYFASQYSPAVLAQNLVAANPSLSQAIQELKPDQCQVYFDELEKAFEAYHNEEAIELFANIWKVSAYKAR